MAFAETFKALSDPVRRRILELLKNERLSAGEIGSHFDMAGATISYHLGILKKAEAMKQYGDAARQQMELDTLKVYFEQLPKIAEAVAKGYTNVESIKMFGGDSSKLAGDIMTTVTQVTDGIKESTGLDINEMLAKGFAKETKSEETGSTANADYHEVKPE